MKTTLSLLLCPLLVGSVGLGKDNAFEVPIFVVRRGQLNQAVPNIEVSPVRFGQSQIHGSSPGRTNSGGKAVITFRSPNDKVKFHYQVTEGPDGNAWFVKFHGFNPNGTPSGAPDVPPDEASALPMTKPELKLEAYPATEASGVAAEELAEGRTAMVGAAVAVAVALPSPSGPDGRPSGVVKLQDPLKSYETVATILNTNTGNAKALLQRWKVVLQNAAPTAKLDEKSLAALIDGDIAKATSLAKMADELSGEKKQELAALSDTGRLIETVYQFNVAVQDHENGHLQQAARMRLEELNNLIRELRPTAGGRSPASHLEVPDLDAFSRMARDKATRF
jgi:hypothetical protein